MPAFLSAKETGTDELKEVDGRLFANYGQPIRSPGWAWLPRRLSHAGFVPCLDPEPCQVRELFFSRSSTWSGLSGRVPWYSRPTAMSRPGVDVRVLSGGSCSSSAL